MAWSPEQDAHLRQCLDDGMTFSEAANSVSTKFHVFYSRNACIGRAGRKGMAQMRKKRTEAEREASDTIRAKPSTIPAGSIASRILGKIKQAHRQAHKPPGRPSLVPTAPVKPDTLRCAEVEPRHLTLDQLGPCDCRWPFGEGSPFTFCGLRTANADASYCPAHDELSKGGRGTYGEQMAVRLPDRHTQKRRFA